MATEKEREAFGYGVGQYAPIGPSAPELDPVMYPDLSHPVAETMPMPPNMYDTGKAFATGPWIWILSFSACITFPCLGVVAIVLAGLARASDKKEDLDTTYQLIKMLKAVSYASIALGLLLTIFLILSLTITLSVLLHVISVVSESANI